VRHVACAAPHPLIQAERRHPLHDFYDLLLQDDNDDECSGARICRGKQDAAPGEDRSSRGREVRKRSGGQGSSPRKQNKNSYTIYNNRMNGIMDCITLRSRPLYIYIYMVYGGLGVSPTDRYGRILI
jgi:hypothetical protein